MHYLITRKYLALFKEFIHAKIRAFDRLISPSVAASKCICIFASQSANSFDLSPTSASICTHALNDFVITLSPQNRNIVHKLPLQFSAASCGCVFFLGLLAHLIGGPWSFSAANVGQQVRWTKPKCVLLFSSKKIAQSRLPLLPLGGREREFSPWKFTMWLNLYVVPASW